VGNAYFLLFLVSPTKAVVSQIAKKSSNAETISPYRRGLIIETQYPTQRLVGGGDFQLLLTIAHWGSILFSFLKRHLNPNVIRHAVRSFFAAVEAQFRC